MINILGFVTLPASNQPYSVVAQPDKQYAVQWPEGIRSQAMFWVSIQPNGTVASRPEKWQLGSYELAVMVPAGLRYTPTDGASYLIAAVEV